VIAYGEILSNRYLVQGELGSGGMSVVYRATDLHTGGTVAIKIPHAFLLRSPQYVQRLKREAEIAANLHSSRIARVTDVSEHNGAPYLVLEFVPGESLAALLARRGALPPVEALTIVLDVARAMQTAHDRGVVHRDIKPQNIYITPAGDVKVLDFGIARMEGLTNITTASVFLGTPDYAAPERAEHAGDIRSDIYSLGVVLYEALTGELPFAGSTPWKTMELHLMAPPPSLPESVPAPVRAIVDRCLEKSPTDRYQTPAELATALRRAIRIVDRHDEEEPVAHAGTASAEASAATPLRAAPAPAPALGPEPVPQPVPELSAEAVEEAQPPDAAVDVPAAPPVASPEEAPEASVPRRSLERPASVPAITGAETSRGVPAARGRRVVPVAAGLAALVLAGVLVALLVLRGGDGASTPPEDAGEPGGRITAGVGAQGAATAEGGQSGGSAGRPALSILEPAEGARVSGPVTVQVEVTGATLKPPGEGDPEARHLHYFLDTDPAATVPIGKPIPIDQPSIVHSGSATHTFRDLSPGAHTVWVVLSGADHVPLDPPVAGKVSFAVADPLADARSGEAAPIVYQGLVENRWRIFRMNGDGTDRRPLTDGSSNDIQPALSPDGSRIAFVSTRDGTQHIYTMRADGTDLRRVTSGSSNNHSPAWRPDGAELVFVSDRDGKDHLWVVPATGGEPRQLTRGPQTDGNSSWSPDGATIAYHADQGGGVQHIYVLDVGGGTPKPLTTGSGRNIMPAWSPDGRQIAFVSYGEGGGNQWDIYVMNADGSNRRRLTDSFFNQKPSWSPDGKQILFHSNREGGQQQVFVVPATGGTPKRLTEGPAINQNASWPLR
jgi:eukaryotic-like serine/threonine-protein kinase